MKVFGIGMQRTGTTSLVKGLNMLGIKACHFPGELLYNLDNPIITKFQGFADNPVPLLYRQLDSRHPNSKFILTIRDEQEWLKSMRWLFTEGREVFRWDSKKVRDLIRDIHTGLYGTTTFEETVFLEKYRAHRQDVLTYFADRPEALLTLDLTQGNAFEKLCPFLDRPIPRRPFPRQNPGKSLWFDWIGRFLPVMR
jgi:hypothetical protein